MNEQPGVNPGSLDRRRRRLAWQHLALAAILILALVIRVWRLDQLPPPLQHEEAYNGLDAQALLDGRTFPIFHEGWELYADEAHGERPIYETKTPPFFEGNFGREPALIYLIAASIWLSDATIAAIRIVPAVFGVISVMMTYLVAKALNEKVRPGSSDLTSDDRITPYVGPLTAALVVAIFFPAVTFSRVGFREILFVPVAALAVYFFWKGVISAEHDAAVKLANPGAADFSIPVGYLKVGWFAAAGFFLGIGLYIFAAARFMPLVFVAFIAIWWFQDRHILRRHWANLLILGGVSIVVSLPLILFLLRQPYYLVYRSRFVANRGTGTYPGRPWITWALNLPRLVRGFIWQGDLNILHNLPGRPYLDPVQLALVASGAVSMVLNRMRLRNQFVAIWLGVMLIPGIFSGDAPHFGRLIGTAIPLAVIMGIGVGFIYTLVKNQLHNRHRGYAILAAGLLLVLLFTSASLSIWDYFVRYAEHENLAEAFDSADWQLGRYAAALPENATIYLSPTQEEMATILYALQGQPDRLRSFYSPERTLLPAGQRGEPVYYLVGSHDESTIERIVRTFPGGIADTGPPTFSAYAVPVDSRNSYSDNDLGISWEGAITLEDWQAEQSDQNLDITLTWEAQVPMERSYTVFVHLLTEDGDLVTQLDRLPDGYFTSDWQEGEIIIDTFRLPLPPELESGEYTIQTGFYYLPTLERLGEPYVLGQIQIR